MSRICSMGEGWAKPATRQKAIVAAGGGSCCLAPGGVGACVVRTWRPGQAPGARSARPLGACLRWGPQAAGAGGPARMHNAVRRRLAARVGGCGACNGMRLQACAWGPRSAAACSTPACPSRPGVLHAPRRVHPADDSKATAAEPANPAAAAVSASGSPVGGRGQALPVAAADQSRARPNWRGAEAGGCWLLS